MDSPATREEHAAHILTLLPWLVERGGDILAVIRGELDRLVVGAERYGALDLDAPHDWQAEEDEEHADIAVYRAIRRAVGRSRAGQVTRSARRHAKPDPDVTVVSSPAPIDEIDDDFAFSHVGEMEGAAGGSEEGGGVL